MKGSRDHGITNSKRSSQDHEITRSRIQGGCHGITRSRDHEFGGAPGMGHEITRSRNHELQRILLKQRIHFPDCPNRSLFRSLFGSMLNKKLLKSLACNKKTNVSNMYREEGLLESTSCFQKM